jgi:hypothetical protein
MKKVVFYIVVLTAGVLLADSDSCNVEDYLFTVECVDGFRGMAFLAKDDDGVWMVSNYHVLVGVQPVKFVGVHNRELVVTLPERIEVAEDRNAARFKVSCLDGFSIATDYAFDDPVSAFGRSDGFDVITKNRGEIIGIGGRGIEVSCDFVETDSGGPLINNDNLVVGIATYAAQTTAEGESSKTRYAGFRRFAIPFHDTKWQEVNASASLEEKNLFDECIKEYTTCRSVIETMRNGAYVQKSDADLILDGWVFRKYNREIVEGENGYFPAEEDPEEIVKHNDKIFEEVVSGAAEWCSTVKEKASSDFRVKYFSYALCNAIESVDQQIKRMVYILE